MAESRTIVRVFLASPSDLGDERKAAKLIVDELNETFASAIDFHIELIGWEDTVSRFGRPQELINRDLDQCELFVGMLWRRWGTPPDNDGRFSSGFHEEFHRAVDRRRTLGTPEIGLLFKKIPEEMLDDPGEHLKQVLSFKQRLVEQKNVLFEEFDGADPRDFEQRFRRIVWHYVRERHKAERESPIDRALAQTSHDSVESSRDESPMSKGAAFMRELADRLASDDEDGDIAPVDVARLRLFAAVLNRSENDDSVLGVHDANLLLFEVTRDRYSNREILGLVASGLEHYSDENTPFWRYVYSDVTKPSPLLYFSITGKSKQRAAAIECMRLVGEPVQSIGNFDRSALIGSSWLGEGSSEDEMVAALSYLRDLGLPDDLPLLYEQSKSENAKISVAAVDAIIGVKSRVDLRSAIDVLYALQPRRISDGLARSLFHDLSSLPSSIVAAGLSHQSNLVRKRMFHELVNRNEATEEIAEALLGDSDTRLRFQALTWLLQSGRRVTEDEARTILRPPKSAFGGLLGEYVEDSRLVDEFKVASLRAMSDTDLKHLADDGWSLASEPFFELARRNPDDYRSQVREIVDDRGLARFDETRRLVDSRFGADSSTASSLRKVEHSIRRELIQKAVELICQSGSAEDLDRVRLAIRDGLVDYSGTVVTYLGDRGSWDDIDLVLDLVNSRGGRMGGPGIIAAAMRTGDESGVIVNAIYALGMNAIAELLRKEMPDWIKAKIIARVPKREFRNLGQEDVYRLLRNKHGGIRRASALGCVRSMNKEQLRRVLADYVSQSDSYFYNVAYWLDFGISVPRRRARRAVASLLPNVPLGLKRMD